MKNKLFYYCIKIMMLISRNKIKALKEPLRKYGYFMNLDTYKGKGAEIGENSILINCTLSSSSKGDRFYIGRNCTLTGTTLLAHDASPSVFIPELVIKPYPYMSGSRLSFRDPIKIGDNVFIGWGSIVLPGVTIGSNVVIGAGSVITKDIPSGVVAAGNPAKVIKPIEEYISSYKDKIKNNLECF